MPRRALLLALVATIGLTSGSDAAVNPSLYFKYTLNCTFTVTDDNGKAVTSILPGTYSVVVTSPESFAGVDLSGKSDMTACKGSARFQLTGPGVSIATTLDDGDGEFDLEPATFRASSTYTAVDNNQPSVARVSFTTQASGTAAQVVTPEATLAPGKSTEEKSVGPGSLIPRGALSATVSGAGKVTLTRSGKRVTSLKAGHYTVTVSDRSAQAGFSIKSLHGKPIPLTTAAFEGSKKLTVGLAAGRWYFYAGAGRSQSQFFVLS